MRCIAWFCCLLFLFLFISCKQNKVRYRIGISQCSDDEWRTKMNKEIEREALFYDGVGIEIRTSKDNNATQIHDIDYFVNQGVDLLIVAPNEAEAITPAVERAFKKKIPVIIVDRKIASNYYTAYVGADNYEIGKTVGNYIVNKLNGKGNIIEITGLKGSTPAIERHRGLMDALKNTPQVKVVNVEDGEWLQESATQQMDSLLSAGITPDLVFAHNDRMAYGAYLAALKYNKDSDIAFVGVDALPGVDYGLHHVNDGILDATFIYPTGGDRVIQTAMNILQDQPYEKEMMLSTALVDKSNARLMQLQTDEIKTQDEKLEKLNSQIDEFWTRYSAQTYFLYACIIALILFAGLLTLIIRAYWTKNRLNLELSNQKKQLESQRDQLIELSKQLEEATQAKLVFFTNISHDFRTPLTLIADPIDQLLASGKLNENQSNQLNIVHKNVNILLRLVNQILDFRKYENGKLELHPTAVNLKTLLLDWSQAFQTLATKKHIHFQIHIAEDNYDMMLDADKMERIYFNLLSNAFKFTPENGTITVHLSIDHSIEPHSLILTISDTGKGMFAEHVKHIFERFYQIDINPVGSGIGLALVKALVDIQQGEISVTSNEGIGTQFVIKIPVVPQTIDEISTLTESYHSNTSREDIIEELSDAEFEDVLLEDNKECILVIDDNTDIRQYVYSLLKDEYCVIEADNGRKGVQMAMRYIPDLVISDIMMPVMDGLECCKILKSELQTSHIPVILLTACSLDEQRVEGLESGADTYISKPFNSKVLSASITNLIQNRKRLQHFFGDNNTIAKEAVSNIDKGFAERFRTLINDNLSNSDLSVDQLSSMMGMSRVQLYRKIKSLTNYSPNELLRIARLKKSSALLTTTEKTIAEIAYEVGFTSPSYFTKCYKEYFGENPTSLLKKKNG